MQERLLQAAASFGAGFLRDVRDLVFAPHCPACRQRLSARPEEGLCGDCRREFPLPEAPLCAGCGVAAVESCSAFCPSCRGRCARDAVAYGAAYAGVVRSLVHNLKYRADFAAGRVLGRRLAARVREALPAGADLLVPVPLHRQRLRERGFNQAAFLARECSRATGIPLLVDALRRTVRTPSLAGLDPEERARAVGGAFSVRRPHGVRGRRVLLVDDVLTTGATAEACCRALKEAGAIWTGVAVAARVVLALRASGA